MPNEVVKRDGRVMAYDSVRIRNAILGAADSVGFKEKVLGEVDGYVLEIEESLSERPSVEEIQDVVESVLVKHNLYRTAKAYMVYRYQHQLMRKSSDLLKQAETDLVDSYLDRSDWKVLENSNMMFSLQGLNIFITDKVVSSYWLNRIYSPVVREAHVVGDLHIHDAGSLAPYCMGWSLDDLLTVGFRGGTEKVQSKPAKHFDTALMHIVNFLYTLQGESAGAQAFSNFDTLLAPFLRYDGISNDRRKVKQLLQKFLFNMNVPTRVGYQTPFTNLTLDFTVPKVYENDAVVIGGKLQDRAYGDFQDEVTLIDSVFYELMTEADAIERPFTFPIPTVNITKDFEWDAVPELWESTSKYGISYFSNFLNSDMSPDDVRSMCMPKGEKVFDGNGLLKDIDQFVVGDEMLSWTLGEFRKSKVSRVTTRKVKISDLRFVSPGLNGTLRATFDHPVLTPSGWKPLGEVNKCTFIEGYVRTSLHNIFGAKREVQSHKALAKILPNLRVKSFSKVTEKHLKEKVGTDYENGLVTVYNVECEPHHNYLHSSGLILHNCCRLRLDNTELRKRGGGLFGSNPLTGSLGVVSLNMPRAGFYTKTEDHFLEVIDDLMNIAKQSLIVKRKTLERLIEQDLFPYSKYYLRSVKERFGQYLANHFSTIGLVGMNEALESLLGDDIGSKEGIDFAEKVLIFMRRKLLKFQEETGNLWNLEASPAEGASYRLALLDRKHLGTRFKGEPYYTNSTQLPANYTDDIFEALELQDPLQAQYTGGTVLHLYLGEGNPDPSTLKVLLGKIFNQFKLPYLTFTPTFSVCSNCGYLPGEYGTCPKCGGYAQFYSRVIGYLRPVVQYHKGKKQEFADRVWFKTSQVDIM